MTSDVPRMRMFAGPNGSGKSTIKSVIRQELLGVFINPDEIESELCERGSLDLVRFGVSAERDELVAFFATSSLLRKAHLVIDRESVQIAGGRLSLRGLAINSYVASVTADFIRRKLLAAGTSFTFETVMSSADKVMLLQEARRLGYRTYLYYVATEDPLINVARVRNRVILGGHPVPEDKIISRYKRSLELLIDAIRHSSRAYVFDNSGVGPIWLAEFTDGTLAPLRTDQIPNWFRISVWDKITHTESGSG